jgi:hypothetical protein
MFSAPSTQGKTSSDNQDQATAEKHLVKSMDFSHALGIWLKGLLNRFSLPKCKASD